MSVLGGVLVLIIAAVALPLVPPRGLNSVVAASFGRPVGSVAIVEAGVTVLSVDATSRAVIWAQIENLGHLVGHHAFADTLQHHRHRRGRQGDLRRVLRRLGPERERGYF